MILNFRFSGIPFRVLGYGHAPSHLVYVWWGLNPELGKCWAIGTVATKLYPQPRYMHLWGPWLVQFWQSTSLCFFFLKMVSVVLTSPQFMAILLPELLKVPAHSAFPVLSSPTSQTLFYPRALVIPQEGFSLFPNTPAMHCKVLDIGNLGCFEGLGSHWLDCSFLIGL